MKAKVVITIFAIIMKNAIIINMSLNNIWVFILVFFGVVFGSFYFCSSTYQDYFLFTYSYIWLYYVTARL